MNLINTYSLNTGSKIDKPFILDSYFPLPIEKFITFQAQAKYEAKNYGYWRDVIDMIFPILSKFGIKIIQLGTEKDFPYNKTVDLRGKTNLQQLAYIIKNSLLHFGPDSFDVHLASYYDIPVVGLYSVTYSGIGGPCFGSKEKQILFEGYKNIGTKKPCFASNENPKSVNTIKPEEIANSIFKLLNIQFSVPFETVYTGVKYNNHIIREFIPNSHMMVSNSEAPIEIRNDLCNDEIYLNSCLEYYKNNVIVTDKPINLDLVKHYKKNIATVAYKITQNDYPGFVKDLISLGVPVILVSNMSEEEVQNKKIDYYEIGKITFLDRADTNIVDKLRKDIDNLYYRSNKIIASNGKMYSSHANIEANKPMENEHEYIKVIDNDKFWNDMNFYTIVRKF